MKNRLNSPNFLASTLFVSALAACSAAPPQVTQPTQQTQRKVEAVYSCASEFELKDGTKVSHYKDCMDAEMNPSQYLAYLVSKVNSAEDVATLLENLIKWKEVRGDRLYSGAVAIAKGEVDCDNIAQACKEVLTGLGQKLGHNFDAKVMGMGDHAICLFTDVDGSTKSIDKWDYRPVGSDIRDASRLYGELDPDSELREVVVKSNEHKGETFHKKTQVFENGELQDDYRELKVRHYGPYKGQKFEDLDAPADWEKYEEATIFFLKGSEYLARAYYQNGKLVQITHDEEGYVDFFNEAGVLHARKFEQHPEIDQEHYYSNGTLKQRDFKNGNVELYSEDGKLQAKEDKTNSEKVQKRYYEDGTTVETIIYAEGEVKADLFRRDGSLEQRNFRDGIIHGYHEDGKTINVIQYPSGDIHLKFFRKDGTLQQVDLRDGATEFYDEKGETVIARQTADGTIIRVEQGQ